MDAKIIDNTSNRVVVHCPGRNFPGIVLQGDTLRHLNIMAKSAEKGDKFQMAELVATLADLEEHYNEVCERAV